MTSSVKFSIDDVALLYSIPKAGGDLAVILRAFVFKNRAAPPSFTTLRDCFSKAMQSGILLDSDGQYQIEKEWYERIHAHDDSPGNEIDSMLDFQEEIEGEEVPVVNNVQFAITKDNYDELVRELQP